MPRVLPERPAQWRDWLAVTPPSPGGLLASGGDFQSQCRQVLAVDLECQFVFATVLPPSSDVSSVLLDLNVVWTGSLPIAEIATVLEKVHTPHRGLFEGFLLDKTRSLFYTPE